MGPDFQSPSLPQTTDQTQYTRHPINNNDFHLNQEMPLPQQWWQLFHSPALDALINEGLHNNPNLAATLSTLREAEQNRNAAAGAQLPQINGNLAVTPQRVSPIIFGFPEFPASNFVLYNASVSVSYNLDLWGGLKREVEAYGAQAEYRAYQMQGAVLALSSNIATTVFKLALLKEQLATKQAIIQTQQSLVNIAQKQQTVGGLNQLDLNNFKTTLLQNQMQATTIQKELEQTQNQLAVYLGKSPSEVPMSHFNLSDFSPVKEIPLVVPSRLVRQRPDILAAEALLHQASANIGVATANMYPQINITGNAGRIASQTDWKTVTQSWIWSFGPNMTIPIFNGKSLEANQKAALASFDIALANYKQTVLQGLQDVADCLTALDLDAKNLKQQEISYQKTHQNFMIVQQQFHLGGASKEQWLNAKIADNQALLAKLEAQSLKLSDTVALFQAMGGGWWGLAKVNKPL